MKVKSKIFKSMVSNPIQLTSKRCAASAFSNIQLLAMEDRDNEWVSIATVLAFNDSYIITVLLATSSYSHI